ncbi:MAG: TPM domain-containing protein, partial [Deltaproteobacteria bacterium]|nr:TPM domain-containing protein [Deltaproteobacteria bacterium]
MFWKRHPKKYFSSEEQQRIGDEIRRAEDRTSGEIRVHLDCCAKADALEKAKQIFVRLGMTKTRQRNGVLIYLATDHKKFAILGDEGIHRVVPEDYWETVKDKMQEHFRQGKISEGICLGVREVGEKLKVNFPFEKG